jgi:hypothetical protein
MVKKETKQFFRMEKFNAKQLINIQLRNEHSSKVSNVLAVLEIYEEIQKVVRKKKINPCKRL